MYLSRQLSDSDELKEYLIGVYASAAQYDAPPTYPVTQVCGGIDRAPSGTDLLGRIIDGVDAFSGDTNCHETDDTHLDETDQAWAWQVSKSFSFFGFFIMFIHIDVHMPGLKTKYSTYIDLH